MRLNSAHTTVHHLLQNPRKIDMGLLNKILLLNKVLCLDHLYKIKNFKRANAFGLV